MNYVIFDKDTTRYLRIFRNRHWQDANNFKTEAAAEACLTREAKKAERKGETFDRNKWDVLPASEFALIEKTEVKYNLLSGKPFTQSVNTPACCDPSTETYHSM